MLSPGSINRVALRNRVVLPGMDMNRCDQGMLTTAEIEHYAARAAGGAGLIITGASAISWPIGATSRKQPGLSHDRFIPGMRALADAVHAGGSLLCFQLVHHGKVAGVDSAQDRPQLVPSIPPDRMDLGPLVDNPLDELMRMASATRGKQATYRIATADDIAWAIEQFADAAGRVQQAGCDAVEIHGAHGYLISTFLSCAYNQRTDEYGGSLANRSRLLVEVIRAVRDRVGADFPIIVRLNGCEYGIEHGITIDETTQTARIAEAAGADAIHVSANAANAFGGFTLGPLPAEVGQYRAMAATVKRAVGIPVIAVGRLLPEVAEEMLAGNECDFVSMGRQMLADPQLVDKIAAGRRRSVRPCINCYVCVEQNFFDDPPLCAVNPALGNEQAAAEQESAADTVLHVVVIGGGPGGLESARIAAQRGHRVTLVERGPALGGATWFARVSGSPGVMLLDWFANEIEAGDIDVHLGFDATVDSVSALHPDVVVIATGADRSGCTIPGADGANVHCGRALEQLITRIGRDHAQVAARRIVVVGGNLIGLSLADFLAVRGQTVTVLEPGPHLAVAMAMPLRWTAVAAAAGHGVTLVRNATVTAITADTVRYRMTGGDDADIEIECDDVLITNEARSDTTLADRLRSGGLDVRVVGDAGEIGYIKGAMHSAHAVAIAL